MNTLENYILKRHSTRTAKRYLRDIAIYLDSVEKPETAKYKDLIQYIQTLREVYKDSSNVNTIFAGISKYYDWLVQTGKRKDNPCKNIQLKSNRNNSVKHYLLFTTEELALMLNRVERYKELEYKNKTILSLLVYQGLTSEEMVSLTVNDVNLSKGTIKIHSTHTTNGRTLNLNTDQIMVFSNYLNIERPKLLKTETEKLIITKLGSEEKGEGISYLISTFKSLFPGKKLNPITIRQSLIMNKFKAGHDTREIQIFSGLKYPSSVERYRPDSDEEMKEAIEQFHPLA